MKVKIFLSALIKMSNKLTIEIIRERSVKIHGNKYYIPDQEYLNNHTNIKIWCIECRDYFFQTANNHTIHKHGCTICAKRDDKFTLEYIREKCKEIHGDKFTIPDQEYNGMNYEIVMICNNCGKKRVKNPNHIIYGKQKCSRCSKKEKLTLEVIQKRCDDIHGTNRYIILDQIYNNAFGKIDILCNKCHNIFPQKSNDLLSGHGCPFCNESSGERKISLFLERNHIKFIRQKKFDNCKNKKKLPFDFYLPDYNICIEFDGKHHFEAIEYFGGQKRLEQTIFNDGIKNIFCKQNGIKLIRIKYTEDIEKILNAEIV